MSQNNSIAQLRPSSRDNGDAPPKIISFDRRELFLILNTYGRMVAAGHWRDYDISHMEDFAVFSIFRRTAEYPIYRIVKRPNLNSKRGMYAILGMDGRILRQGMDLGQVLKMFERKLMRVVN
ncbi:MAG: DUF2794 domain-containing protein [Albidovulum sp.]|nr:DUF2794 domain-containing protein [Albidovulum sp.]MDE0307596.1 DUF2794 domain-containing protein [Albidovulum sp.]MDE0533064.1 DUF2794 domain-containing protein [Albidovulum sp.]